ncbi:MAG: T9SS type A sorting domain-containing protein [Ignavibacteria bacterium]|nr:T9SS type A sorting domain-containing protein [Ignavibacteria bacterium]
MSTADGGITWKPQASGTANQLSGVSAINDSTAWIIGNGGTILKVTGKREAIVISVNETEFGNNDFENYPNPATTSSKIKFTIDESSIVSLDLFTMTGYKAQSLIDQTRFNAGTYSMIIDVDALPSGVYYYVLTSGSRVMTDKIVITR